MSKPADAIWRVIGPRYTVTVPAMNGRGDGDSVYVLLLPCRHARRFKRSKLPPSGDAICYECMGRRSADRPVRPAHVGELQLLEAPVVRPHDRSFATSRTLGITGSAKARRIQTGRRRRNAGKARSIARPHARRRRV